MKNYTQSALSLIEIINILLNLNIIYPDDAKGNKIIKKDTSSLTENLDKRRGNYDYFVAYLIFTLFFVIIVST